MKFRLKIPVIEGAERPQRLPHRLLGPLRMCCLCLSGPHRPIRALLAQFPAKAENLFPFEA